MKKKKNLAFKGGTYSIIITAIVIALVIVANIIASSLPASATQLDISAAKLYSVTSNTKAIINNLEKDVTIYWIVQNGEEDQIVENLLSKYDSLSDHLEVVKKNPDVYPTFAEQYTSETVTNNSLIVECGERYRYIAYEAIYVTETDYSTYSYSYYFDGEGAITSAVDYVTSEDQPVLYVLEGHGEAELSSIFSSQLQKENIDTVQFSLLNEDSVPDDADCVLIYAPSTDISKEEKEILSDYCTYGGKLLVLAGPSEKSELENLYSLLEEYGVEKAKGIVIESDRNYYAFQAQYILLPGISECDITTPLLEGNYYVIVPLANGLITEAADSCVTEFLTTSSDAYSKTAGFNIETYDKETGDIDGPFALGVTVSTALGGEIAWFTSSEMLNESYNSYSSGANLNLVMNALSQLVGETEAVSIRSKSLNYTYLTISESAASVLKTVMIGIIPGVILAIGIIVVIRRRRKQNEAH